MTATCVYTIPKAQSFQGKKPIEFWQYFAIPQLVVVATLIKQVGLNKKVAELSK